MSYQQPQRHNPLRPYTPSYDSFTPPFTNSTAGSSTPVSESSGSELEIDQTAGSRRPRPAVNEKHEVLYMGGGTGMEKSTEPKHIARKRTTIMIVCGTIVAAIITVAILGVKKIL
ncbi:uncharacterized protein JCM15063_004634 [Sporobolomyces koalae]|uniref:uncharacterized protein n=1 Tax=Sporobolomyces koalae TaxID=500713 RepID=UPI0031826B21